MIKEFFDDEYLKKQREKWLKIGLSIEPANRKEAEKGVDLAYKVAGLKPPKIKIWFNSPLKGAIEAQMLDQVKGQVWNEIVGQTKEEVIRALIDRTQHCHDCLHHDLNIEIVYHLRKALVLHEMSVKLKKVKLSLSTLMLVRTDIFTYRQMKDLN